MILICWGVSGSLPERAVRSRQGAGLEGLVYVEGEHLPGDDGEATVDSSHPTDLGMIRMADALEPVLRPLAAKQ